MKRTLIEFYDKNFLENIIALFGAPYDRVKYIYLEGEDAPSEREQARLAQFVRERFGIEPEFLPLRMDGMGAMLERFWEIVGSGGRFDFDVTGGTAVFIAASGLFVAACWEDAVFLVQYEVEKGRLMFCYPEDEAGVPEGRPKIDLTIPEVISLNGASFLTESGPNRYELDKSGLRREVLRLWNAVKHSVRGWNSFCALSAPEHLPKGRAGKLFEANRAQVYDQVAAQLRQAGIISDERRKRHGQMISVHYRLNVPEPARFLYDKGGNVLELISYLAATDSGVFSDICGGAMLDWDGYRGHRSNEPCNEIDLIFTYGHIPVLVSCKGTHVEKEYLYEITTMARHFGGPCARPVLISAVRNRRSIHNRASEMGVLLLDDVCSIGVDGLACKLRKHFPKLEENTGNDS